jgi:hypothetical protein
MPPICQFSEAQHKHYRAPSPTANPHELIRIRHIMEYLYPVLELAPGRLAKISHAAIAKSATQSPIENKYLFQFSNGTSQALQAGIRIPS